MTTTGDLTPIKVSGPAGLLAAVPPMLGFHPANSLVLMCLSGDRRRVGPVARVDLPRGHDRAMAKHLTAHAVNHADEVVVISYQNSCRRPPLLDDLLAELASAGVEVMDAIVVQGGRARPALSAAMENVHPGIPIPGADDPQVAVLTAAGAMAGRSVLANREQLRSSIAGPTGKRLRIAERAVDKAMVCLIRSAAGGSPADEPATPRASAASNSAPPADELPVGPTVETATDLIDRAFDQVTATGTVDVQLSIALSIHLSDVLIRNAVLARAIVELDRPWLPTLIACATWTPDIMAAPLCSVLAMVAYRHGDGALAQVAVDRCLVVEPKHPLAHLMIAIMSAGIRPEELERIAIGQDLDLDYIEHLLGDNFVDDEEDLYHDLAEEDDFWWGC